MTFKSFHFVAALSVVALFGACKKDDVSEYAETGSLTIEFDNQAGDESLIMGKNYVTAAGDTVKFSTFDYIVSNFILIKEDGSEYVVPKNESYFIVRHDQEASHSITLNNIPGAAYKAVRYTIGVDSLMSTTPAEQRPTALDPITNANGMYWTWNSGYIFVKVEGISPQAPVNEYTMERTVMYHVGGYGGNDPANPTMNNLKTVLIEKSGELAQVGKLENGKGIEPEIHVFTDILEVFKNPTAFKVADNPVVHWGAFHETLSKNYQDMFKIDHIHN
jgi:hypothetical protein